MGHGMSGARFTETDVRRAVQGAVKGGVTVAGVEIAPDGTIRLIAAPVRAKDMLDADPVDLVTWRRP